MSYAVHSTAREIRDGITLEIAATPKLFVYTAKSVRRLGEVVTVSVDYEESLSKGLDESLEGAAAWWPGPPKGYADVLSVDAEHEQIHLRYSTVSPNPA